MAYLKSKLTRLSDNCGGKVLTVSGTKAIIRFPNSEAALRCVIYKIHKISRMIFESISICIRPINFVYSNFLCAIVTTA